MFHDPILIPRLRSIHRRALTAAFSASVAVVVGFGVAPTADATPKEVKWRGAEKDLRYVCTGVGGIYSPSGQSSTGSYGCVTKVSSTTCDKNGNCTTTYTREVPGGGRTPEEIITGTGGVADNPLSPQ